MMFDMQLNVKTIKGLDASKEKYADSKNESFLERFISRLGMIYFSKVRRFFNISSKFGYRDASISGWGFHGGIDRKSVV